MAVGANTWLISQVTGRDMARAVSTGVTASIRMAGTAGQPDRVQLSSFIQDRLFLSWRRVDLDSLRKIRTASALSYCTSRSKDRASSSARSNGELFDLLINPGCRPPLKKDVLGSAGGVLIQVLDVHPFPKISNAHKDVQLLVSETDGMRDIATF